MPDNSAPSFSFGYQGLALESQAAGTLWGIVSTTDADGDAVSVSIVGEKLVHYDVDPLNEFTTLTYEEPSSDFYLSGNEVRSSRVFDYDSDGYHVYHVLTLRVTDTFGNSHDQDVTLTVNDIEEIYRVPFIPAKFSATNGADTIQGSASNEIFSGNAGSDTIYGDAGNDKLYGGEGGDTLFGGEGKDVLIGGGGLGGLNDTLNGGLGADLFTFKNYRESLSTQWQVIEDFSVKEHDKIDLRFMDADIDDAGRQDFHFIGTARFSGEAGELRYHKFETGTAIAADVNGDARTDFYVWLDGRVDVTSAFFLL